MKLLPNATTGLVLVLGLLIGSSSTPCQAAAGSDPAATSAAAAAINTVCPVTGKAADPAIVTVYEGRKYAFADAASRSKWQADREKSLYHRLGGKGAIEAAVESFYVDQLGSHLRF